jgi:hypothetical protein
MIKKSFILCGLIVLLSMSLGCAGNRFSRLEKDYGRSFEEARFNQILNPEAEKNLEPVYGLDGVAAKNNVNKYQKDFETAPETPWFFTGVGGITGSNR